MLRLASDRPDDRVNRAESTAARTGRKACARALAPPPRCAPNSMTTPSTGAMFDASRQAPRLRLDPGQAAELRDEQWPSLSVVGVDLFITISPFNYFRQSFLFTPRAMNRDHVFRLIRPQVFRHLRRNLLSRFMPSRNSATVSRSRARQVLRFARHRNLCPSSCCR